jgi:DNA polymerase III alpha subunit
MLQGGDTVGCNQIESPAMRHLLRMMRPSNMIELMQALALIRPGAASLGMKEHFVRRARGLEEAPPGDPRIDEILRESHGIMLYEDDALFVAGCLGGLSVEGADQFRRAVTRCRSDRERLILSEEFLGRCRRNGVGMALAKDLWVQMAKFNSYSFCRAHAASYALLAYTVAYLKSHYPAQFWTAALNNNAGMYAKWVYIEEAKRAGIRVMLPCVNCSGEEFELEDGAVRTGFTRVGELSQKTIRSILKGREKRTFEGVVDFMARTCAQVREAENLIRCGAFDFTGISRPAMLWQLYTLKRNRETKNSEELVSLPMCVPGAAPPELDDYTEMQKFRDEWDIIGLSARKHPLAYLGNGFSRKGLVRSRDISSHIGGTVRLAGVLAATRITRTGKGGLMEFLTLDDGHGIFEVTIFPDAYRRLRGRINGLGPYLVTGKIEDQYSAFTVKASDINLASAAGGRI